MKSIYPENQRVRIEKRSNVIQKGNLDTSPVVLKAIEINAQDSWKVTSSEGDQLVIDHMGSQRKLIRPHSAPSRSIQNTTCFVKPKNVPQSKPMRNPEPPIYDPLGIPCRISLF